MSELDADRIASAALAIATKRGVEGFSMRAVADALGVTPMALYHHVKDKAELAALVVDAAIRNNPLPSSTGDWRNDLLAMARWMRGSATTNRVVGQIRRTYNVWTPSMLSMTECWLSLWQQSGLDFQNAVLAARMSSMAITGLVAEEAVYRNLKLPAGATLTFLPNVRVMFEAAQNRDEEFELVVRSLIDGLYARLTSNRNTSSRPTKSRRLRKAPPNKPRRK